MKIICIVDNAVQRSSPFWGEHGLAFLIETDAGRLLFDTGQSGMVLLHNLEVLDVDPATIDALAISHAHYFQYPHSDREEQETRQTARIQQPPGLEKKYTLSSKSCQVLVFPELCHGCGS